MGLVIAEVQEERQCNKDPAGVRALSTKFIHIRAGQSTSDKSVFIILSQLGFIITLSTVGWSANHSDYQPEGLFVCLFICENVNMVSCHSPPMGYHHQQHKMLLSARSG